MNLPEALPPCRFCGQREFVVSPNVAILWDMRKGNSWRGEGPAGEKDHEWRSGESTWKTGFKGGALVCKQCGHVELFMANVREWLRCIDRYPWHATEAPEP